jgi:hypothetical protein
MYILIRTCVIQNFIFAALSSIKQNVDSTNCILVQDVKAVTHDQMTQDSLSTQPPTEGAYDRFELGILLCISGRLFRFRVGSYGGVRSDSDDVVGAASSAAANPGAALVAYSRA